mmetsp:Transcript_42088/g.63567  ORF Transcript_42088/g.63567 Transcript_42088/m.63567 type:complete len:213 (-) Transcript_42088:353-991(-)|eukprot:CAMPEP_0206498342 /NCGR_PEP_ID=MMETSP0324_2-20121206/50912_1 /ASSEMBLY_ACC=CAM_ASM_000836 /TAXON_ID=2866 /ORGANISM="Crypthecodinium cohnii, Strain Seligo" /LENGTH=212 /DNA_ID=CAMNT_0053984461 /DNA_START=26 /DNA_END=664 /DNA_ORIENTATION=+
MSLSYPSYSSSTYGAPLGADQMSGLMELLGVHRTEEQDDYSKPPSLVKNPKTGGQASQAPPNMKVAVKKAKKKDEGAIWQPEEFKAASGVVVKQEESDDRAVPRYEIMPRMRVGASDAFMNMQEMDPSSDSCQEMLIKIWLPDTQLKDISVDVLEDRVLLQAPKYRLNVALPHKVRKDSGNAKWDKLQGLLSVVVPVDSKVKYYSKFEDLVE